MSLNVEFDPQNLIKQLTQNYERQVTPYEEIVRIYNKMLQKNIEMNEKIIQQRNKQIMLEQTMNYKDTVENLIKEKESTSALLIKSSNEVDKLNLDLINLNANYNEMFQQYNEEKSINQTLKKSLEQQASEIAEFTQQVKEKDLKIAYQAQIYTTLQSDFQKIIQEKQVMEKENNLYVEQIKKQSQQYVDKLNEFNELEEQIQKKQLAFKTEQDLFHKMKKNWETMRDSQYKQQQSPSNNNAINQNSNSAQNQQSFQDPSKSQSIQKNQNNNNIRDSVGSGSGSKQIQSPKNFLEEYYGIPEGALAQTNQQQQDFPKILQKVIPNFHQNEIYTIECNINGSSFATCAGDRLIKIYDPIYQDVKMTINTNSVEKMYTSIKFSTFQDEMLLAGSTDNSASLINFKIGKIVHQLTGHSAKVNCVGFLTDREKCITGSNDKTIKFWDVNKGFQKSSISCYSVVNCIETFNYEPVVVSGHKDGSIRMYSTKDQKCLQEIKNYYDSSITSVCLSTNNNYLISTCSEGNCIKCLDLRMMKNIKKLVNENLYLNSHESNKICFGPQNKYVISGNYDGKIFGWDLEKGIIKETLTTDKSGVMICCQYHEISGYMFSGDSRGNLFIWK